MSKGVKSTVVGIDLGTTYSRVAAWSHQHNHVQIIPNDLDQGIPSCVAWDGTELLVGNAAKDQINKDHTNAIVDVKRLMGSRFSDSAVQKDIKSWPFEVIESFEEKPMVVVKHGSEEKQISPEGTSSLILKKLKTDAEAYLQTQVVDAVITVPAHFTDIQRKATMDAGVMAGLNVLSLLNEPSAAAITHAFDCSADISSPRERNVLVFDMGGGTFDVSLVNISMPCDVTVKAVVGDTHFGGEDFVMAMVNLCVQEFKKRNKKDVSKNAKAMVDLKAACEKAKIELSLSTFTTFLIESLYEGIDFFMKFTRAKFEELNASFFRKCIEHVEKCLRDGNMQKKDVDDVLLVGGSKKIPKLQQVLREFFDHKPLCESQKDDQTVAFGAALYAAHLSGKCTTTAIDLRLSDVIPLSLGIRVHPDDVYVVIPRNTPIPTMRYSAFETSVDNQESMSIDIYQGGAGKIHENRFLDKFTLTGIPAAPAGEQGIYIYFEIDPSGILNVHGEVISTGKRKSITMDGSGNLSEGAIKNMLEKHKQ